MALELNLKLARNSMWDALHNWPETTGVFVTEFDFNQAVDQIDIVGGVPVISISDFPAIAIMYSSMTPEWFAHEQARWTLLFSVCIWTQDHAYPEGEDLIENVWDALYRATPAGETVTYVKKATSFYPKLVQSGQPLFVQVGPRGETKATLWRFGIGLQENKDPFAN
jgi:hypothetical protein